ncbi:hypothetical protein HDU84_006979 [Entophlyctis sp. JEL0112]|nr:hypothetical protein HDU84_006979 [Entophlyctis sp. JEL0112]
MRDAMQRLQSIHDECVPEAKAALEAEKGLDEFTRLRKKIAAEVKTVRVALREREDLLCRVGTTPETAETSYRIRESIKELRRRADGMKKIVNKEAKKNYKDEEKLKRVAEHKEVLELTIAHIEELDSLEKRRFNEGRAMDRADLMAGATTPVRGISGMSPTGYTGNYGGNYEKDPFSSELPDIDVEDDFKHMNEKNKAIDADLEVIGQGVQKLKELAQNMGNELDRQDDDLDEIQKAANNVLDHLDNVNLQMRKAVDGMMTGDKFMIK